MEWTSIINTSDSMFLLSAFFMVFNPVFWNIAAQSEYHFDLLSSCLGGSKKFACTFLAVVIIILCYYRATIYHEALMEQPVLDWLPELPAQFLGLAIIVVGLVLTLGAFYRLGFYGVYLGDYFGIFVLDAPVTAFPYSVSNDPLYFGSVLSFLGGAVAARCPAGLLLSTILAITYSLAVYFEGRMLTLLYQEKSKRDKSQ